MPHLPFYSLRVNSIFFLFTDTAPTEIYTLSLHDALPISRPASVRADSTQGVVVRRERPARIQHGVSNGRDRKSTRLNSSYTVISYAVFCLKKKKSRVLKRYSL